MASKIPKSPGVKPPAAKSPKSSGLPKPPKTLKPLVSAVKPVPALVGPVLTVAPPQPALVVAPALVAAVPTPALVAVVVTPKAVPTMAPAVGVQPPSATGASEITRALRELEERLSVRQIRTVERGVSTSEERRLILLRTETVRVERVGDEEKEKLKRELAQARRDNATLYVMLEDRKQQERAPSQVRMPEIPKLDLERRRVKKETAERLRRLEDVLPRGFILKEVIRSSSDEL